MSGSKTTQIGASVALQFEGDQIAELIRSIPGTFDQGYQLPVARNDGGLGVGQQTLLGPGNDPEAPGYALHVLEATGQKMPARWIGSQILA
jgi:hypothetical protein